MNIHLMQGVFSSKDALDIVTQMINVKVKYHESKISNSINEEDIKMREKRIKQLQKELYDLRQQYLDSNKNISITGELILK